MPLAAEYFVIMCGRFGAAYRDLKTVWTLHGDFSFQKRYNIRAVTGSAGRHPH